MVSIAFLSTLIRVAATVLIPVFTPAVLLAVRPAANVIAQLSVRHGAAQAVLCAVSGTSAYRRNVAAVCLVNDTNVPAKNPRSRLLAAS